MKFSTVSRDDSARRIRATPLLDDVLTSRLPPGQVLTTKWPVLHYGDVPKVDTGTWTFEVSGLVDRPFTLTYDELLALPRKVVHCDIHCVTRWSRLDNTFEGVGAAPAGARGGEARRAVLPRQRRAGVHHQPAARGSGSSGQPRRVQVERGVAHAGARRACPAAGAAPVLLEEREVGAGVHSGRSGRSRVLGAERLPHAGRSVDGRALWRAGAHATRYQSATESQQETPLGEA